MKNEEPFGLYLLQDAKADSKRNIASWRERALIRIVEWNEKHCGTHIPHALFALTPTLPILIGLHV